MKEWMAKKSKEEGYSRSRLPSFTKEEIEMVKGEFQFRPNFDVANKRKFFSEILQFQDKESHLNTIERFFIYAEF